MYNILICDDEKDIVNALKIYLNDSQYQFFDAYNGKQALEIIESNEIHLVLLDIMMPVMDGIETLTRLRQFSNIPVIFLTAKSEEVDMIMGLNIGADDYITKPFSMSVLYAKMIALIKRNQRTVLSNDRMEAAGITLEISTRKVYAGKKEVTVTPKEFVLLRCLMQNRNLVMSREQLLVKCWGYDYEGEARAVDTHIKRLREKLGDYADCIKTVIKAGYRLEG